MPSITPPPWEPQPGEPSRWFDRFDAYRRLGPGRSIAAAYRASVECASPPSLADAGGRPSPTWYSVATIWRWEERARAWDAHVRAHLRDEELAEAAARRRQRLTRVEQLLDRFEAGLQTLLAAADTPALQALLPVMGRDLAEVVRLERAAAGEVQSRPRRGGAPASQEPAFQELLRKLEQRYGPGGEGLPE